MKRIWKLFAVAVGMMLASAPAFAISCNGITQHVADMLQYELAHTEYHADMLWFALTSGDYRLLMEMTACSTNGVMSTLLFNPAGWAADVAMFFAVPVSRKWLKQLHSQFAQPHIARS